MKTGDNKLRNCFHSPIDIAIIKAKELSYNLPEGERVFVRKAQYQFGWDFAPRLLGCGIWKPVFIKAWNDIDVKYTEINQKTLNQLYAQLSLDILLDSDSNCNISIEIIDSKSNEILLLKNQVISIGESIINSEFAINNPVYWWTYDLGEPYLYNLEIVIKKNQKVIFSENKKIGLRTIELVEEKDSIGESFYFKLNDKPLYIKGSNYVPQDMFPSRVTDNQYRKLLGKAKWSNINMLRVWGGGIYEKDVFYDLCDSLGLLVWQDFMFACAMYPGDDFFLTNLENEVTEQVKRLKGHPSIALWCGNNEIEEGWNNWGWQKQYDYSYSDSIKIWQDYEKLFHSLIPEILKKEDTNSPYWPSSPKFGWGREESLKYGDIHYWGVWWGMEPFEKYKEKVGRFNSEYGFQSLPTIGTIEQVMPKDKLHLKSDEIECHQKHPKGFETIDEYMKRDWPVPENFEDYIYVSQLVQAKRKE
ncbi:MAG: hypothetical protein R2771_02905 [Saprospiraceae bacterium]